MLTFCAANKTYCHFAKRPDKISKVDFCESADNRFGRWRSLHVHEKSMIDVLIFSLSLSLSLSLLSLSQSLSFLSHSTPNTNTSQHFLQLKKLQMYLYIASVYYNPSPRQDLLSPIFLTIHCFLRLIYPWNLPLWHLSAMYRNNPFTSIAALNIY